MLDVSARRPLVVKLLWFAAAIGAIFYCRHYWDDAPGVSLYVEAARCMWDGQPLQSCNPAYTYPPIFALVTIPVTPLPLVLQNLIWYVITLGALFGCFAWSGQLAPRLVPGPW